MPVQRRGHKQWAHTASSLAIATINLEPISVRCRPGEALYRGMTSVVPRYRPPNLVGSSPCPEYTDGGNAPNCAVRFPGLKSSSGCRAQRREGNTRGNVQRAGRNRTMTSWNIVLLPWPETPAGLQIVPRFQKEQQPENRPARFPSVKTPLSAQAPTTSQGPATHLKPIHPLKLQPSPQELVILSVAKDPLFPALRLQRVWFGTRTSRSRATSESEHNITIPEGR
jgi:hypothetical protein